MLDFRILPRIGFVEISVRRFDRELAAIRHRIAGIDRDIQDRALELLCVGTGLPQTTRGNRLDLDQFAERRMQQVRHAGNHFVGVDCLRRQRLLPREGQKPLGEDCGALGRVGCGFDEALNAEIALANAPQDEIVRADDHAQHIVEIVSDAAGQLAERLHLLRLPKLVLGFLAAADLLDKLSLASVADNVLWRPRRMTGA